MGRRWYADETYIKVKGKWCYLYRAIDRDGNLVDSMLSANRDMNAAQRFFRSAQSMTNTAPKQVTTDGHDSYPRSIRETLGPNVQHRCSAYLNRRIDRNHRAAAEVPRRLARSAALNETRQSPVLSTASQQNEVISLSNTRRQFLFRTLKPESLFLEAKSTTTGCQSISDSVRLCVSSDTTLIRGLPDSLKFRNAVSSCTETLAR